MFHALPFRLLPSWITLSIACCLLVGAVVSADDKKSPQEQAAPPKWSRDVLDTFFSDAREELEGPRPDYDALAARTGDGAKSSSPQSTDGSPAGVASFRWSELVRPETLEDEIKRISRQLAGSVASSTDFKGGAYRDCRQAFSMLAVLFGVIAEYDQRVRWHEEAAAYRDMFARAGFNCKVGTDQSFKEAVLRSQDLQNLIRGSRIDGESVDREASWPEIADRPPLMQRMESAYEERLSPWLADGSEFRSHRPEIRHEAELLAVLAEVISREGYEFADDAEYAEYARQLTGAAREVTAAVDAEDFQRASDAAIGVTSACIQCHEGYRS